MYNGSQ